MSARLRLTFVAALATTLAALALSSTFDDGNWFWPVVTAIAAGAMGCAAARRIGLPRPLVPLLGLVLVVVAVTWLNARDVAVYGLIPGPGALRALDDLASTGFDGIRRYATPAPTDPGLVLLAMAGAGLVAVVVDTLAVTYRSAAMAGVPLLVLYAVPLTVVRGGVPMLLFIAAAVGWLGLMLAEGRERLSGWGRALGRRSVKDDDPLTHTPPEPLGVVGRRIGAAAVGLALIVPAVMPWAGTSIFKSSTGGSGTGGGGNGNGTVDRLIPTAQLSGFLTQKSEVTLLKYTSDDTNPDYFRVVTLDRFDGNGWLQAPQQAAGDVRSIPTDLGSDIDGTDVTTTVNILGLNQDWLPVPYPGGTIDGVTGRWAYDAVSLDVFRTSSTTTQGQHYAVHSRHLDPTATQLRDAPTPPDDVQQRFTKLPSGIPSSVLALTRTITAGAETAYDKAVALQAFFIDPKSGFTYTTNPTSSGNPLVSFLKKRAGFCQQFAGAFAVMARQAGLPTRVEVGFTPGSAPDSTGTRSVTNHNAHAWPEVFFSGIGWVRFEPTASAPVGVAQPVWAPAPGSSSSPGGSSAPGAHGVGNKLQQDLANDRKDTTSANLGVTTPSVAVPQSSFPWALLLGGVAVVLMLLPSAARVVRRRRRLRPVPGVTDVATAREQVRLAWLELSDTARDLQDPWPAARTPRRTVDWLTASGIGPDASAAAYRLARSVERSRYARNGVDVLRGSDPAADARTVAVAMEAVAPRRERWRARFIPVSVLAGVSERFADLLDWTDDLGARLRDLLRRPFVRRGTPVEQ